MTRVNCLDSVAIQSNKNFSSQSNVLEKDGDNIFSKAFRKAGMEGFADFLRDDWVENRARKAGMDKFADWLANEPDENGIKPKSDDFFSNTAREIIKHPVITIATIVGTVFAAKYLYKITSGMKNTTNITNSTVKSVVEDVNSIKPETNIPKITSDIVNKLPEKSYEEEVKELTQKINEGLFYEKEIKFSNLEIFDNLTDRERDNFLMNISMREKELDLLYFASGNKPGIIDDFPLKYEYKWYDVLKSDSIDVKNFWYYKDHKVDTSLSMILNKQKVKEVIMKNKDYIINRLEMPANSSIDDIYTVITSSKGGMKMSNPWDYADIKALLSGSTQKNAFYSLLKQDIREFDRGKRSNPYHVDFYGRLGKDLETIKKDLIGVVEDKYYGTYHTMPQSLRDKVKKDIDSLTLANYNKSAKLEEVLFNDDEFKQEKLKAMRNLVAKLEETRKNGTKISFS